jgi:dolichol-phosphate mannosyltransferase
MSSLWLVLPTYNEAPNLEPFVLAALPQLRAAARHPHILIVDDGSPDGTGQIADRLAAEHDCVEVLHRAHKDGLGRAYLAGFARALDRGADRVLQMDADFSHDPADIGRIVAGTAEADVVVGSRYVPGGSIPEWSALRRLVSRVGCRYARTVLQIEVRDLTAGFKCFRREVLERLDLSDIDAEGYGFQIEMTYRAVRAGFTVVEEPISFGERRAGTSKMHARIVAEALWRVPALRVRVRVADRGPLHAQLEAR